LVELLVVIGIIGMLVGLGLPAINAAREQGRATVCKNNLRQIALAAVLHESVNGFYPSGGWAGGWAPVPGRTGQNQPGSWVYALLPYVERNDLAELGKNLPPGSAQVELAVARLLQTPISVFNCPTRRRPLAYPLYSAYGRQSFGSAPVSEVARSDYAMDCGDQATCDFNGFGPSTLEAGDDPDWPWPDTSDHTGISYMRSRVTTGNVRDGLSRTYLVGEKWLSSANYDTGADHGDDWSMYNGYQDDGHRCTNSPPARDSRGGSTCRFGSGHASLWHVSFCDASVRGLAYDIDPVVHRNLGNRADGQGLGDDGIR
jgi:type II secretory pathway pseudopilin PulG